MFTQLTSNIGGNYLRVFGYFELDLGGISPEIDGRKHCAVESDEQRDGSADCSDDFVFRRRVPYSSSRAVALSWNRPAFFLEHLVEWHSCLHSTVL